MINKYLLSTLLVALPLGFIVLGYFAVFGLILWLFLFLYYTSRKDIPWYFKVLIPIAAYLLLWQSFEGLWSG